MNRLRQELGVAARKGVAISALLAFVAALLFVLALSRPFAQGTQVPAADQQVFDAFVAWMTSTPDSMKGNAEANYRGANRVELEGADLDAELEQKQPHDDWHAADKVHEEPRGQPNGNIRR